MIWGSKMGPMPEDSCLVILHQKLKPTRLGGTSPYFYEYPHPGYSREKMSWELIDYLKKDSFLFMNDNDLQYLFIPEDFCTFEPEKCCSVQNVNLLDSRHVNRLEKVRCSPPRPIFFQVKGKYLDYWSAIMIHKVLHTWIELPVQGELTWKWGTGMCGPEDPLLPPPGSLQDPLFTMF